MEMRFKTRKWRGGNLFSFDAVIDGWVEPQLLWCWKLPVLIKYNICIISVLRFSLFHLALAYCKTESSSLFFVGFIVVVEEIYTSVACDTGDIFWTYNLYFLQLADCCFSCSMTRKLFLSLSLRLVSATDTFITLVMVFLPIGLVWTRCLNFRFRLLLR